MDKNLKRVKLSEEKKNYERKIWKKIIDSRRMLKGKRIWKRWENLWKWYWRVIGEIK